MRQESKTLIAAKIPKLQQFYLKQGLKTSDLYSVHFKRKTPNLRIFYVLLPLLIVICFKYNPLNFILSIRCVVPNNYFIWEATRPISDCSFCSNVTQPIILQNDSNFLDFTYTSQPVVVKGAFLHWPAKRRFSWQFFKDLYGSVDEAYRSVDEECQFLHFKSDFISISDVFSMSRKRVDNRVGERSWYVGWGNCHPTILQEMRKYYPKPHFLPEDAEIPHKEYVFMGYDDGATMHLDFINRLMWQAQLQGSKIWHLLPPPECQSVCSDLTFEVQPGDGVLVDTRIWYHATTIPDGQFSLSVQSEYG